MGIKNIYERFIWFDSQTRKKEYSLMKEETPRTIQEFQNEFLGGSMWDFVCEKPSNPC